MPRNLTVPQRERLGQLAPQSLRQVRHLLKFNRPSPKQPIANLTDAIYPLTAIPKPRREQVINRIQQMRHQFFSATNRHRHRDRREHRENEIKTNLHRSESAVTVRNYATPSA